MSGDQRGTGALGTVLAAISIGAMEIATAVSLAAFVFSGELRDGFPRATVSFLLGSLIVFVAIGSTSTLRGAIASAQDTGAVVAAAIGVSLVSTVDSEQLVPTMIVALFVGGLLGALVFLVVGQARVGELARSIPFTVISGFMAGTGWLLFLGGLSVMTDSVVTVGSLGELFSSDLAPRWIVGLLLAGVIVFVLERSGSALVVGTLLLLAGGAIHLVGRLGWSIGELESNGWLLGPFSNESSFRPVGPSDFADADWDAVAANALPLAGLAAVALIGMLLNLTGLEVACEDEIDIDRELRVSGLANALAAAVGGIIGYHMMSYTVLTRRMGVSGRVLVGVIASLMALAVLVGPTLVAGVPRAVAGAILVASGSTLALSWLRQLRTFSRIDIVLSGLVLAAIVAFGVLTGIAVGVLAAVVVFVYNYGRISPIRRISRMSEVESNFDRPPAHREVLGEHGEHVAIVELHGFLFFGSVRAISDVTNELLAESAEYLILDLRGVRGVDASVVSGLQGVERRAASHGVHVVWAHVRDTIRRQFAAVEDESRHFAPDLDHAVEWVEEEILRELAPSDEVDLDLDWLDKIAPYGSRRTLAAGETLVEISDTSGQVFAVESGSLSAWGTAANGEAIRYRRVGPGSFLGEIAFTTGAPRSATVVADVESVVVGLSRADLDSMFGDDPELALATERLISARLAERLAATSRIVRNLSG